MKNWIIDATPQSLSTIGEFFVQFSTIEHLLGEVYFEFVECNRCRKTFDGKTFGNKINELNKIIKLGRNKKNVDTDKNLTTRLSEINLFRNEITHNSFEFEPKERNIVVRGKEILSQIKEHNLLISILLTDLYILLLSVRNSSQFKSAIRKQYCRS